MSEWLDLMLEEIARKQRETETAAEELRRRADDAKENADESPGQAQSK